MSNLTAVPNGMKPPRLYTLFGQLTEDSDDTILLADVCEVDALRAYRDKRDYMRSHGFRVVERKDEVDNLPYCVVRNPLTGKDEVTYWLRETA